jgi:tetratricopeptide (TPR) repeat protein
MNELLIRFSPAATNGGYDLTIEPEPGKSTPPVPFLPFLTDPDYDDLRWYLEELMDLPDGGAITRAKGIEDRMEQWGRQLHDAVFSAGPNQALLAQLRQSTGTHTLTIATSDLAILRLPWELMADAAGALCLTGFSVRRQLAAAATATHRPSKLPLRILLVVSRPGDLGFIDPRLTSASLLDALKPLGDNASVDFVRPPTLARLQEMLAAADQRQDPYDLVHFEGHGTFLQDVEIGALCFEQPDSDAPAQAQTDYVRADRLGQILAAHRIPLVILEACRSGSLGKLAVFRAVAPRLIEAGVGSVISMGHAVHVEAARIFLERFYRELVQGVEVGQATGQGRASLLAAPARWLELGPGARTVELHDWFLPHLYQRGDDQPILPAAAPVPDKFDVFLSHNSADKPRVERLAMLLKNRHGLRVWFDAWQVGRGLLHEQCVEGVKKSRVTLIACTNQALESNWVTDEKNWAFSIDRRGRNILPLLFEAIELPPDLLALMRVDFLDPAKDADQAAEIARLVGPPLDSEKQRPASRAPAGSAETGAFPRPPQYGFQGRARELYEVERQFRRHRAILLHAMGGMGKTSLATEAAHWWTRTGLFPDGACFVSFEQFASADRVVQVLGEYLEGVSFNSLPAEDQHRRARELFQQKRVLLVWDNFESVLPQFQPGTHPSDASDPSHSSYSPAERQRLHELFRDLTDAPGGHGRLLITCRPLATGLATARVTELRGLARPDALGLLVRVLEKSGVDFGKTQTAAAVAQTFESAVPPTFESAALGKAGRASTGGPPAGWKTRETADSKVCATETSALTRQRLNPLLDLLVDHPLSIELVGPHLKRLTPEEICQDFGTLLAEFKVGAGQERNESLLASLAFSTRRLSDAAQAALPWLGRFSGGVFEYVLLEVSQIPPAEWEPVRAELEATALIRIERDLLLGKRPYLRFHPTLAYAAAGSADCQSAVSRIANPRNGGLPVRATTEEAELRQRFIAVYFSLGRTLDQALRGSQSRAALEILAREESNYRTAVRWAVAAQAYDVASALGDTFRTYLERSGRLRERNVWVAWLAGEVGQAGFTAQAAELERQQAWALFTQGQPQAALDKLKALLARLRQPTDFDPAFPLATTQLMLGRVLHHCGLAAQAIPVLEEAQQQWEKLVEKKAGDNFLAAFDEACRSRRKEAGSELASLPASLRRRLQDAETELGNLSATLGDLANALSSAGRLDEALEAAEKGMAFHKSLGRDREVAASHIRCAQILAAQGRHAEADARYDLALAAARRAGDKELEGTALQHQGGLADDQNQLARAASLYQRALKLFQEANNEQGVMQTCNLLGVVEQKSGRLDAARTWYERSREIAQRLGDTACLGQAAQNIGIVCQQEGEAARQRGDERTARQRFEEAKRSFQESLSVEQDMGNKPQEASSRVGLARIHLPLGEFDLAETQARKALEIWESLGLKEVHYAYWALADIARARGDAAQAAEWERKRDTVLEELQRRAQGPGGGGLPPQFAQAIQQLALACAQAGFGQEQPQDLDPGAESALAQIEQLPAPLPDLAAFLRRLAARELPSVPATLPPELQQFLTQLLDAIREGPR